MNKIEIFCARYGHIISPIIGIAALACIAYVASAIEKL